MRLETAFDKKKPHQKDAVFFTTNNIDYIAVI